MFIAILMVYFFRIDILEFKMLGRVGCTLPKPHCKQVSHLHIVEGALPLTEIALQCSYPCLDFYLIIVAVLPTCFNKVYYKINSFRYSYKECKCLSISTEPNVFFFVSKCNSSPENNVESEPSWQI